MQLRVRGLASDEVERIRGGGPDANGQPALRRVAEAGRELTGACRAILADRSVAYVHVRSKFNCFQCRVDRT